MRSGQPIRAFYGSTVLFDFSDWDISKTREFGYHFGLEDESQSLHRIALTGGYLYEVRLTFSKPLMMRVALRWDLRAISDALGVDPAPHIADASRLARNNFSSPRVEGNLIAAQLLDAAGYDAIIYENMGESGGTAAVIWHSEQIEVIDVKKIQGSGNMRITERQLRQIIRESILNEVDIEDVGESCWAAGSTHELSTCSIGGDQFYLKFSDERRFDSDDPSLQILNEYLSYQIYKLYPDASTPSRIELVYDKTRGRVGLASAAVERGNKMMSSRQLAALLSAGVYVDIFLANWDISNTANVIVSPEGDKATRIDLGGNLDFRAQGKRKGKMFGDDPGELSTMLPTSPKKITDIFTGSDLRVAADTFLGVPWPAIAATVQQTHENVLNDLTERGMETLAGQWNSYVAHVTPILAKRHRSVALHAQHILDTGGGVTEARLRRFINETLAEDEDHRA